MAGDGLRLLGVLAIFAALGLLLPVGAEPPMGDAWSYMWSARQLAEHGELRLTEFQAMALVGQLLLTWPATRLVSSEPAFLNLLTFGFSAATACLFFLLLRALGATPRLAWLGLAVLVSNALYLHESMTYDTEIYFLFASLAGSLAFVIGLRRERLLPIVFAGLAFALAALIRQHALVLALAAALTLALRPRSPAAPPRAVACAAALAPTLVALAVFYAWLHLVHTVPQAYVEQQVELWQRLRDPVASGLYALRGFLFGLHYLGLFLLPLLPIWIAERAARRRRAAAYAASLAILVAGTSWLWSGGLRMPYLASVISPNAVFVPARVHAVMPVLTGVVTWLSALLAAAWLAELASRWLARRPPAERRVEPARVFVGAVALLLLGFTIATGIRFDRYLLIPLPFLIALLLPAAAPPRALVASWALVLLTALFTLYHTDQSVRSASCEWQAAHTAHDALGYPYFHIDGGFSFNGYYSYQRLKAYRARAPKGTLPAWNPVFHPAARLLVRAQPMPEDQFELVERVVCPNHLGLPDFVMLLYRRVEP